MRSTYSKAWPHFLSTLFNSQLSTLLNSQPNNVLCYAKQKSHKHLENDNFWLPSVLKVDTKGRIMGQKTQNLDYVIHGWSPVDVLWGHPIKLIQGFSTLEFQEYRWNDVVFIFSSPWFSAGPQKPHWLLKNLIMKNLDQKFKFLIKK